MISELPHSQPQITGGGDLKNVNYKPGDLLNLTCTSAPSNPPAKLEWILNDEPVSYIRPNVPPHKYLLARILFLYFHR